MILTFGRNWWALVVRGIAAIAFGVLAIVWPGITALVLAILFGAYALVDGIFALVSAFSGRVPTDHWWGVVLEGLVGVAVGIFTFFWPGITLLSLVILIAIWAIATGVLEIIAAIRLREHIRDEWLLVLGGIVSILFGVAVLAVPPAGLLALVWINAIYALVFGALMIALGIRLRNFSHRHQMSHFAE